MKELGIPAGIEELGAVVNFQSTDSSGGKNSGGKEVLRVIRESTIREHEGKQTSQQSAEQIYKTIKEQAKIKKQTGGGQ